MKPGKSPNRKLLRSKQVWGKVGKTGRLLQEEKKRKQACWGKSWRNGKIAPRGKGEEASVLGEKLEKCEDCSKRKKRGSKRVGVKVGKM